MTHADALAAAIRGRLVAGRPAPLPGLGTLVRQHVPARVETRPDGSRSLLPPGETVGLAAGGGGAESLAPALARAQGLPAEGAEGALAEAMDQVEARLAATGEVRLPGVGVLRRTSGSVVLSVEADLLSAVNQSYEGLLPVAAPPLARARRTEPPLPPTAPPEEPTAEEPTAEEPPLVEELTAEEPAGLAAAPTASPGDTAPEDVGPEDVGPEDAGPAPAEELAGAADGASARSDDSPPVPDEPEDVPEPPVEEPDEPGEEPASLADEPAAAPNDQPDDAPPAPAEAAADEQTDGDRPDAAGLAVPFGGPDAEPLADLLPPTPPADDPAPGAEAPADDEPPETWTAAGDGSAPPLSDRVPADGGEPVIVEDAEQVEDAESPPPPEPEATHPDAEDAAVAGPAPEDAAADAVESVPPPDLERGEPAGVVSDVVPDAEDVEPGGGALAEEPAPVVALERFHGVPVERVEPGGPDPGPLGPTGRAAGVLAAGSFVALERVEPPPRKALPPAPADAAEEERPEAPPPAPARPRRPWWVWALGLLVLVAVVALALFLWSLSVAEDPAATEPAEPAAVVAAGAPTDGPGGAPESEDAEPQDGPPAAAPSAASRDRAGGGVTGDPGAGSAAVPAALAGLSEADRRALAGGPFDPADGGWTLVVFSARSPAAARDEAARYREAGYRTAVLDTRVGSGTWHRVGVGHFGSEAEAARLRGRLPAWAPDGTWAAPLP